MIEKLEAWLTIVVHSAGAAVTIVFSTDARARLEQATVIVSTSSDAAGDGRGSPGFGGYTHGYYWRVQLEPTLLALLHITAWETLAACVNILIAARLSGPQVLIAAHVDALLTPFAISNQRSKSEDIQSIIHLLLRHPRYSKTIAPRLVLRHLSGDGNVPSDLCSRGLWTAFEQMCMLLKVKPVLVVPDSDEEQLIRMALMAAAERRGLELDGAALGRAIVTSTPVRSAEEDQELEASLDETPSAEQPDVGRRSRLKRPLVGMRRSPTSRAPSPLRREWHTLDVEVEPGANSDSDDEAIPVRMLPFSVVEESASERESPVEELEAAARASPAEDGRSSGVDSESGLLSSSLGSPVPNDVEEATFAPRQLTAEEALAEAHAILNLTTEDEDNVAWYAATIADLVRKGRRPLHQLTEPERDESCYVRALLTYMLSSTTEEEVTAEQVIAFKASSGLPANLRALTLAQQLKLLADNGLQDVHVTGAEAHVFCHDRTRFDEEQPSISDQRTDHGGPTKFLVLEYTPNPQPFALGHVEPVPTGDGDRCVLLTWTELRRWAATHGLLIIIHTGRDQRLVNSSWWGEPTPGLRPYVGMLPTPPWAITRYAPVEHVGDDTTVVGMANDAAGQPIGMGLFAAKPILKGELVASFGLGGETSEALWQARRKRLDMPDWAGIGLKRRRPPHSRRVYDASWTSNQSVGGWQARRPKWARMNHSKRGPTCAPFKAEGTAIVMWTAKQDLAAGDELTWDYGGDTADFDANEAAVPIVREGTRSGRRYHPPSQRVVVLRMRGLDPPAGELDKPADARRVVLRLRGRGPTDAPALVPVGFVPIWARGAAATPAIARPPLAISPDSTSPVGSPPRVTAVRGHPYARPAYGHSRLRVDQHEQAMAFARRLRKDTTPGRIRAATPQLEEMALAVAEARADGINPRTASKDQFALREWEAFAELSNFDPNLQSEWTRRFSERESLKLASWLMLGLAKVNSNLACALAEGQV